MLLDGSSRGLLTWFWTTLRSPGQTMLEVVRYRILTETDSPSHFSKWMVAEIDGEVIGALCATEIDKAGDPSDFPEVFAPLLELYALAVGTWHLWDVSVFPEHRGRGFGTALLVEAENLACRADARQISLVVETANVGALTLYRRYGFGEHARRPYLPFPGSTDEGDWLLLVKDLA